MLDSFELFCIEKYKDNFNIWYRSDMMGSIKMMNFILLFHSKYRKKFYKIMIH